jgi:hypothetical protein
VAVSRADDIARRAAQVAAHAAAAPEPAPVLDATVEATSPAVAKRPAKSVAKSASMAPRIRKVRHTVDLDPVWHRMFKQWLSRAAEQLELPSVHGSDTLRALVEELVADPELSRRITERLRG